MQQCISHRPWALAVCICTCIRADVQMYSNVRYFGNGRTDCAKISCFVRDQLARHFTQFRGWGTYARAYVSTFLNIGNDWTGCAEIYVVRDQLAIQFAQAMSGVHLHMRAGVSLFRISGTGCWPRFAEICYVGRGVLNMPSMVFQYPHVCNLWVHGIVLLKYGVLLDPLTLRFTVSSAE